MLPLVQQLIKHNQKKPISFHIPGHKYGEVGKELWNQLDKFLSFDVTELRELDDLHDSISCIREAQTLAARLYHVEKTYFLVNGSTVGNLAMIMATLSEGDKVIVQRNCHKSIMNGLHLVGAKPIFISSRHSEELNLPVGIYENQLINLINHEDNIKAIILTTPNYYGYITDIREIVNCAHKRGIPVLIDEAHGAHFVLGSPYPMSAIEMGADVIVHSAHKTLPALTMASFLHFNSKIVQREKIEYYLKLLQSSSPSYLIMASLDISRAFLSELKKNGIEKIIENHQFFKEKLNEIKQIKIVPSSHIQDPLKVIIQTNCELNGFELQKRFEEQGIYTELADENHVLCVLPLSIIENIEIILQKVKESVQNVPIKECKRNLDSLVPTITFLEYNYKEMEKLETMYVPFNKGVGCIAAEDIIPYPPGVPVIIRGEKIRQDIVEYLIRLKQSGAKFQGSNIDELGIKVIKK